VFLPQAQPDMGWLQLDKTFRHPYTYLMFLGTDARGNLLPTRALRDKYCVERRDVHSPDAEDGEEGEDGSSM
jgi:hypothetical protein